MGSWAVWGEIPMTSGLVRLEASEWQMEAGVWFGWQRERVSERELASERAREREQEGRGHAGEEPASSSLLRVWGETRIVAKIVAAQRHRTTLAAREITGGPGLAPSGMRRGTHTGGAVAVHSRAQSGRAEMRAARAPRCTAAANPP